MKKSHVNITYHARQRLNERLPDIHPSNYNAFVSAARYNGQSLSDLARQNQKLAGYIAARFRSNNSTKIKYYRDCVFVFSGDSHKARTLVTVVNLNDVLDEFEMNESRYVA